MDTIIRSELDSQIAQSQNEGRLTGAKPPLGPKHVLAVRTRLQLAKGLGTSRCLTSPSIASFVGATSLR